MVGNSQSDWSCQAAPIFQVHVACWFNPLRLWRLVKMPSYPKRRSPKPLARREPTGWPVQAGNGYYSVLSIIYYHIGKTSQIYPKIYPSIPKYPKNLPKYPQIFQKLNGETAVTDLGWLRSTGCQQSRGGGCHRSRPHPLRGSSTVGFSGMF